MTAYPYDAAIDTDQGQRRSLARATPLLAARRTNVSTLTRNRQKQPGAAGSASGAIIEPMTTADFRDLRGVLSKLSLREADLGSGDAVVNRLSDFRRAIVALDTSDEPWVGEWLDAEHLKAAMLHTAAMMNWRKEATDGTGPTFNARNRQAIISRFNDWSAECRSRLDSYEQSPRTAADVAHWRAELDLFRQDPVRNP